MLFVGFIDLCIVGVDVVVELVIVLFAVFIVVCTVDVVVLSELSILHPFLQYPQYPFPPTCVPLASIFVEHQYRPSGSSMEVQPFLNFPDCSGS